MQAELEAAKRCHLEEMEKKIEKERSVAQQQLALEMDRKKREAEQELKLQRHEYEERLAELERMLVTTAPDFLLFSTQKLNNSHIVLLIPEGG